MGVEPTIRSAKDRIASFEGRESHRTKCASADSISEERTHTAQVVGAARKCKVIGRRISNANRCGLVTANQGGDQIMQRLAGADFVIGMRRSRANFAIGQ